MTEIIAVCLAFLLSMVVVAVELTRHHRLQIDRILTEHRADAAEWKIERQKLLDRIQATSYAEYKTQEIRTIKAQNGEKEPPKLEPV